MAIQFPADPGAQSPPNTLSPTSSPIANTENGLTYLWNGSVWNTVGDGGGGGGGDMPTGGGDPHEEVFYENQQVIDEDYQLAAGTNAMTAGPITVNSTVTVPSGQTWTVVGGAGQTIDSTGFWGRSGTTLSPANSGDSVEISGGNIVLNADGTINSAANNANFLATASVTASGAKFRSVEGAVGASNKYHFYGDANGGNVVAIATDGSITGAGTLKAGTDNFFEWRPAFGACQLFTTSSNANQALLYGQSQVGGSTIDAFKLTCGGKITAASEIISGVRDQDGVFMTPAGAAEGWNGGSKVWSLGSTGSIIARSLTVVNGNDNLVDLQSNGQNIFYRPTNSGNAAVISAKSDVNGTESGIFELTANGQLSARKTIIDPIASERRIKENIELIDPVSAWETIKSTSYYSYNYIGTDPSDVSYGPIVDEVPAEMIIQPMEENEVGVMVERSDEEGPIRTFDNGMLQARLYTALQTALTRIEALEAKLAALSGPSTTDIQEGN